MRTRFLPISVEVALDGAQDHRALFLHAGSDQQGTQHRDALFMRGRHQNLGDKDLVVLEFAADDVHAGQQAVLQNVLGGDPFVNGLLNKLFDLWRLAGLQIGA